MGKAKKRKKLTLIFGKIKHPHPKKPPHVLNFEDLEEEEAIQLHIAKRKEKEKRLWDSMKKELEGIKKLNQNTPYQKARHMLYEALLPLEAGPNVGADLIVIREAGKILYQAEGMRGMHDYLLWSFIPSSCQRLVGIAWDGIGDWTS